MTRTHVTVFEVIKQMWAHTPKLLQYAYFSQLDTVSPYSSTKRLFEQDITYNYKHLTWCM
jgi:hypothetical protein